MLRFRFVTCNRETRRRLLLCSPPCSGQCRCLAELPQGKCRSVSRCRQCRVWLCRARAIRTASGVGPEQILQPVPGKGPRSAAGAAGLQLPACCPADNLGAAPRLFGGEGVDPKLPPCLPVASSKRGSHFLHRPKEGVDISHEDSFAFEDLPADAGLLCEGRRGTVIQGCSETYRKYPQIPLQLSCFANGSR